MLLNIPANRKQIFIIFILVAPEIITPPDSIISRNENTLFILNLTARANPAAKYSCTAANVRECVFFF